MTCPGSYSKSVGWIHFKTLVEQSGDCLMSTSCAGMGWPTVQKPPDSVGLRLKLLYSRVLLLLTKLLHSLYFTVDARHYHGNLVQNFELNTEW